MRKKMLILALICIGTLSYSSNYTKVESEYKDKNFNERVWVKNEAIVNDVVKRKIADSGIQLQISQTTAAIDKLGKKIQGNGNQNQDKVTPQEIKDIEDKIKQLEKTLEDLKKTVTSENQSAFDGLETTVKNLKNDLKDQKIKSKLVDTTSELSEIENELPVNPTVEQILDLVGKLKKLKGGVDTIAKDNEGGNSQTTAITNKIDGDIENLEDKIIRAVTDDLKKRAETAIEIQNGEKENTSQNLNLLTNNIQKLRDLLNLLPKNTPERQALLNLINKLNNIKKLQTDKNIGIPDFGTNQVNDQDIVNQVNPELRGVFTELLNDINKDKAIRDDKKINGDVDKIEQNTPNKSLQDRINELNNLLGDVKNTQAREDRSTNIKDAAIPKDGNARPSKEDLGKTLETTKERIENLIKKLVEEKANSHITNEINNFKGLDPKNISELIKKLTDPQDIKDQTEALEKKLDANKIDHLNNKIQGLKDDKDTDLDKIKDLESKIQGSTLTNHEKDQAEKELQENLEKQLESRIANFEGTTLDQDIKDLINHLPDSENDEKNKLLGDLDNKIDANKVNQRNNQIKTQIKTQMKRRINNQVKADPKHDDKVELTTIQNLIREIDEKNELSQNERNALKNKVYSNLENQLKKRIGDLNGEHLDSDIKDLINELPQNKQIDLIKNMIDKLGTTTPNQDIIDLINELHQNKQQALKNQMAAKVASNKQDKVDGVNNDIDEKVKIDEKTIPETIEDLKTQIENNQDLSADKKTAARNKLYDNLENQLKKRIGGLNGGNLDSDIKDLINELPQNKQIDLIRNMIDKLGTTPNQDITDLINKLPSDKQKELKDQMAAKIASNKQDKVDGVNNLLAGIGKNNKVSPSTVEDIKKKISDLPTDKQAAATKNLESKLEENVKNRINNYNGDSAEKAVLDNLLEGLTDSQKRVLQQEFTQKQEELEKAARGKAARGKVITDLGNQVNNLNQNIKNDNDKQNLLDKINQLKADLQKQLGSSKDHQDERDKINALINTLEKAKVKADGYHGTSTTPDVGNSKVPQQDFKINGGHFNL